MPMNADQKRFLAAALAELEEHLCRFERLLQQDETVTIFQRIPNPFRPEQRRQLLEHIAAIKEHLRAMRDSFGLPIQNTDLRWQMTVTLLHSLTNLAECEPKRLRSFGDLDEPTAAQISQFLEGLTDLLNRLSQTAKE